LDGHDTRGLRAFRETYGKRAQTGLIVYAGQETHRAAEGVIAVPWNAW
jgi:hypothetical protein